MSETTAEKDLKWLDEYERSICSSFVFSQEVLPPSTISAVTAEPVVSHTPQFATLVIGVGGEDKEKVTRDKLRHYINSCIRLEEENKQLRDRLNKARNHVGMIDTEPGTFNAKCKINALELLGVSLCTGVDSRD